LKEIFEEAIFSSNIIKNPKSLRDGASKEKKRKEKKRKKAPWVPSNKRGSQYFERRKTLQLQKLFLM
jgi:hypothetical protein